ncbi:MAG: hypothetical protein WD232_04580 [Acidimicrobiales bacterium]
MSHPQSRPAHRPRRCVAALVAVLAVAGCADGGTGEDQVVGDPDAPTTTTGETSTTTTTTTTSTTTSEAPETTTTQPFDGGTEPVTVARPASTQDVVAHTDLSVESAGGEERITFGFDGALPGVDVAYTERPIRESGSGNEVDVEGGAVLAIRFEPASSARFDGEEIQQTYTGPDRVPGEETVEEVVRTGDFEAVYEWAAGLESRLPFRVEVDEAAATVTIVVPAG